MNNKYIIDGVEYEYGEEVEVADSETWFKGFFVSHIPTGVYPVGVHFGKTNIHADGTIDVTWYKKIRKIQPTPSSLSGRKAKLILDGVEHTVTFE